MYWLIESVMFLFFRNWVYTSFFSTLPKLYYFTKSPYDYLKNINETIMSLNESDLIHVILYGNKNFDNNMNKSIITATIKFMKDSERFDQPLF